MYQVSIGLAVEGTTDCWFLEGVILRSFEQVVLTETNLSVFLLFISLALYGVLHSVLASHTAKNAFRKVFGERAFRWYRLLFSLVGGALFLPILALLTGLPYRVLYSVPSPWTVVFWIIQGGGLALGAWSLAVTDVWTFIGVKQPFAPPQANLEKLVIRGPYRWVRHPMYSASLLLLWFVPQMTTNWLALSIGTTIYFVIGGYFEERKLLAQFGQDYARYRAQTPMLIPRFYEISRRVDKG